VLEHYIHKKIEEQKGCSKEIQKPKSNHVGLQPVLCYFHFFSGGTKGKSKKVKKKQTSKNSLFLGHCFDLQLFIKHPTQHVQ